MEIRIFIFGIAVLSLLSCKKTVDNISTKAQSVTTTAANQFIPYTILKGEQYCDKSTYQSVKVDQLSFIVRFDSSAIYHTSTKDNQDDINKLLGFSDNNEEHHQYSARFGWRWSNSALHLFGYIYNNGVRSSKDLGTVDIGTENSCSIKVKDSIYVFTLNEKTITMPRESKTLTAEGYKLFPYFGGDELAPHTITIWIKEL